MKVGFLSIGDELLIGQTINTNVTWLGSELSRRGYSICKILTIKDDRQEIEQALDQLIGEMDIVLITGGLGPTKDDITKKVLADYFHTELVLNQEVLSEIEKYFSKRGRPMLQVNIDQALLPKAARILKNDVGTAAGMWFTKNTVEVISMPGVPYEMKHIMTERVFPLFEELHRVEAVYYETLLTQGIGESFLAERIADIEDRIRQEGMGLAYLPHPGYVRLRVTGKNDQSGVVRVKAYIEELHARLLQYAYGRNEDELSAVVGDLLKTKGLRLGTVESCTGGRLGAELVRISGSSAYYNGGFITYSNELKQQLVGVKGETLEKFGAVSEQTVTEMAVNGKDRLKSDYCIAISGIAGPDGGSEEKPVGTVWIAIAGPKTCFVKQFLFGNDRNRTIEITVATALNLLRCMVSEINFEKSN